MTNLETPQVGDTVEMFYRRSGKPLTDPYASDPATSHHGTVADIRERDMGPMGSVLTMSVHAGGSSTIVTLPEDPQIRFEVL